MTATRVGSLFLRSTDPFLLKHPLANVRGTIHYLNAEQLALVKETNSVKVNDMNFIEIQSCRPSELLEFLPQLSQPRTSKVTR
jgi:hypothetical protein